jgi:hypothetical protein
MNSEIESMRATFPEYSFRLFPDAKHDFLRAQAGSLVVEDIAIPPNEKTGFTGFAGRVTRFHLKAFAATAAELAKILSGLNKIAA